MVLDAKRTAFSGYVAMAATATTPPQPHLHLPQRRPTQTFRHLVQTHYRPLFKRATRLQDLDAELKLHPSPTTRSPANSPSLATPDKNVRSPWVPISLIKFVGQLNTRSVSLPPLLAKLILPRNNLTAGRNRIRVNLRFPNVNTTVRPAG